MTIKSKLKDVAWPGMMCAASGLNMCAAGYAVYVGADKTPEGAINPFFYVAALTSFLYCVSNGLKTIDFCCKKDTPIPSLENTFVHREERRREYSLTEVVMQK